MQPATASTGLLIAVAAAAAGLCLISAHAKEPPDRWITQDGNISCAVVDQTLRCDVARHSWPLWGCQDNGCYGTSFVIPSKGKAQPIRSSDTTWSPDAAVIGEGKRFAVAGITCQAQARQLSCQNATGGRMVLSKTAYRLNR